jgi:hypothetical protein
MQEKKVVYTVALDPADIRTIEASAKRQDLPARVYLRHLILKALREEGTKGAHS